jgi:hypothetical protein
MSGKYTGRQRAKRNTYKLPMEYADVPSHGIRELTDLSQKPVKTPTTIRREAVASLYCGRAVKGQWPVLSTGSDKVIATLSLRRERLCFKLRPGVPGADGKIHIVPSKHRRDGLAAIARKIAGFQVETAA